MKNLILACMFMASLGAFSQIDDGSIAPDFTLTDWYGETHNLYSYLNDGKTVFLEIFAAHCPSCWGYHQTERLKNMYNLYGPEGTDEVMVLALEYDQYNTVNAFTGIGEVWNTAGNWLEGTPYPQFNVEGADREVFVDFNVTFYPVVYKICPDRITERMSTSTLEDELYEEVQECEPLSIKKQIEIWSVYFEAVSRDVIVNSSAELRSLAIINLQGQLVKTIDSISNSRIDVSELDNGIYLFEFKTEHGSVVEKLNLY
ncbi:MAG TPA: hypothetical protein DHU89_07950 [Flavobacteriales bacterium]|nr:hypothetical protein [Flavobacteriales bacterium]